MYPTMHAAPEALLAFAMGLHLRIGQCSFVSILSPELVHKILDATLDKLCLKRAKSLGKYVKGRGHDMFVPSAQWLSNFMTVDFLDPEAFYYRIMWTAMDKRCSEQRAFDIVCKEEWEWAITETRFTAMWWDRPLRFFVQNAPKKDRWQYQLLFYETHNLNRSGIEAQLRNMYGDDNFEKFVRLRELAGGTQVFVFGPGVPIDIVLDNPIFVDYSHLNINSTLTSISTTDVPEFVRKPFRRTLHNMLNRMTVQSGRLQVICK